MYDDGPICENGDSNVNAWHSVPISWDKFAELDDKRDPPYNRYIKCPSCPKRDDETEIKRTDTYVIVEVTECRADLTRELALLAGVASRKRK